MTAALGVLATIAAVVSAAPSAYAAGGHTWYVSAAATAPGNGSKGAPFQTLAAVQAASGPGDTIVVLPAPASAGSLDGGIALKRSQHLEGAGPSVVGSNAADLPRIANTTAATNNGDAVELADGSEVSNLVITGSYRGSVYGSDVTGATVHGNDISGQNTSCANGFLVQPFLLETYTAGVDRSASTGVQNGWAAILFDNSKGTAQITVDHNYVHDGVCGDGIDIRTTGRAKVSATVRSNDITRLPQGATRSVIAIGMQPLGHSSLTVTNAGNSETYIGSAGADCEGQFANPAESGTLVDNISNNVFAHGIGGGSCNGFEYILSNGNAHGDVSIANSTFTDNPGDMLEEFNYGAGSVMNLTLSKVVVSGTTIAAGTPPYANPPGTATQTGNLGECMAVSQDGGHDQTSYTMKNSTFSGCDNDGIQITNNLGVSPVTNGTGIPTLMSVDIDNSSVTGSRYYNLWMNNLTPLGTFSLKVQHSNLSGSGSGVAVGLDQQPTGTTKKALVDLGGGALGSTGGNCLSGGALADVHADRYDVSAQHDWWGGPGGPAAGTVIAQQATVDTSHALNLAPARCG